MSVRRARVQNRVHPKSVGVTTRSMRLLLDADDQNGNKVACGREKASSPDSARSSSSLSGSGRSSRRSSRQSPADVEMLDCCLGKEEAASEGFPVGGGASTNEGFGPAPFPGSGPAPFHGLGRGQDEEITRTESSGKPTSLFLDNEPDNWNGNLALAMSGLQDDADTSPDSAVSEGAGEPAVPPRRVSSASVSSGETAPRNDGFGLSDSGRDSPPSASLPGGSPAPSPKPADIGTASVVLPDVCDGLRDGQRSSGSCTPVGDCTFVVLGLEDSDTSGGAQTSTPLQSLAANNTFCLPPSSASPFGGNRGDVGSPAARPPKGRPRPPVTPSPAASRPPPCTPHRRAKTEPARFPQPDLKDVKSRATSRPTTPLRVSNLARVATTPGKPAPANRNTPAASAVQRKGEAGDGGKRDGTPLNSNKGVTFGVPQRVSECDSTVILRPRQDDLRSSAQRETPNRGSSSANNVTFTAVVPPSERGRRRTPVRGDHRTPGQTARPAEADPRGDGTTAEHSAEEQEAGSALAADGGGGRGGKLGPGPSPGGATRGASSSSSSSSSRTPAAAAAADLRTPAPAPKDGRVCGSMSSVSRAKHTAAAGILKMKMRLTERQSVTPGAKITFGVPQLVSAGASRLPVKSPDHGEPRPATGGTPASVPADGGKAARPAAPGPTTPRHSGKPPATKPAGVRTVALSPQRKALVAGAKNAAAPNQTPSKSAAASPLHRSGSLQRSGSGRFQRPATTPPVDRSRQQRASPRTQPPAPTPAPTPGPPDLLPAATKPPAADLNRARGDGANGKRLQQLKKLLASGNRRFEAVAVVIQHIVAEREDAEKLKGELSQELLTLRGELVTSSASCEALEREKDELRATYDGIMRKLEEQHRSDMADREERLKDFYSAEWEKMQRACQEEADRCQGQMQKQVDDFKSKHEALRKGLEDGHAEKLESLKRRYETTLEELRKTHQEEMETLDKTLKETEAKLSEQVQELTAENSVLKEKMNAVEERRRILAEKCQKDSHTLYLEQELESLKVVLDIKNKQLHQQDKKLMQMDKLMEKSVKLDECLKKVQQENEDLKARMDRHAALSRQLSTEQAVLQESLQKESKVNKRLSMENEELLWKLHNGDLSSPRKLSPTSPSKSFPSPFNSDISSAPVSPR